MHARELVDLVALAAGCAPQWLRQPPPLSAAGLQQYAAAVKARCDLADRWLADFAPPAFHDRLTRDAAWQTLRPVADEILAGDLVVRIWGACLVAHDRRQACEPGQRATPVAEFALHRQADVLHRLLARFVRGDAAPIEHAAALNRLRQRCERWGDLWTAGVAAALAERGDDAQAECALAFAYDPGRAQDFAEDWPRDARGRARTAALWRGAQRASLAEELTASSPHPELNAQLAAGMLAAFNPRLFNGAGDLQREWPLRLAESTVEQAAPSPQRRNHPRDRQVAPPHVPAPPRRF